MIVTFMRITSFRDLFVNLWSRSSYNVRFNHIVDRFIEKWLERILAIANDQDQQHLYC